MKVLYTCDNNYVWLMGISAISLFETNQHLQELTVYLLGENISLENKEELKKIGDKYRRKVEIIDVPKLNIPPSLISARWPLSAFTRLFSGIILPDDVEKVLYLDCDTIIMGDISELDSVEFNGNIAMGVKDGISGAYKKNIGLHNDSPYYNAGVFLLDVNALRKVNINEKIEQYMNKYVDYTNYADQDILNGIFNGKIGELNARFNVMTIDVVHTFEEILALRRPTNFYTKSELENAIISPAIIHYTTNMLVIRPWFSNTDHPFASEFRKYMEMSTWKDRKLDEMVLNSRDAKVIGMIMKLPKKIAFFILGIIHAELKPRYIELRTRR